MYLFDAKVNGAKKFPLSPSACEVPHSLPVISSSISISVVYLGVNDYCPVLSLVSSYFYFSNDQLINSSCHDSDLQLQVAWTRSSRLILLHSCDKHAHLSTKQGLFIFHYFTELKSPDCVWSHGQARMRDRAPLDDPGTARLDSGVQVTKKYSLLGSALFPLPNPQVTRHGNAIL